MNGRLWIALLVVAAFVGVGSIAISQQVVVPLTKRLILPLDVASVTTGGTAVTAISAGHRTAGAWLQNPTTATINLCINEIGAATGTVSSGNTTCIAPGQSYTVIPSDNAVSVITSDSTHGFSGYGLQ